MANSPKNKVGMGHEICYALEHTSRLEDKRWKGDLGEVHADSVEFAGEILGTMSSWSPRRGRT
jgi:hypothetical protein